MTRQEAEIMICERS